MTEKTSKTVSVDNDKQSIESDSVQLLDSIDGLTDEQKSELLPVMEMYSGPIPHPQILKQYDSVYHGAAKKIINNGVAESKHRRMLENVRTWTKGLLSFVLLLLYFGSICFFAWLSYKIIMSGHAISGSAIGLFSAVMGGGSVVQLLEKFTDKDDVKS